jgi:hypothetical protein
MDNGKATANSSMGRWLDNSHGLYHSTLNPMNAHTAFFMFFILFKGLTYDKVYLSSYGTVSNTI